MKNLGSKRNAIILILLLAGGAGFAYAIPAFPLTYEESYEVEVPYDEQEAYTVQVPYSTMEDKQQTLGSTSDRTIEGGYSIYWDPVVHLGRDIEFSVSASDTVFLYIFSASQYANYRDTGSKTPNEKESLEISSGKIGYHVSSTGTYYFCVYNPHDGFLGIGAKSVGVYSSSVVAFWQEEVTKYRTETRYQTVTKTRMETHTREVTIRVTLFELLSQER